MQTPALPSYDFTGQVALVTGASSGMGLATARAFASQGASVTLADIDATRLRTVTDKLVEAGHPVEGVVCDVAALSSSGVCQRGVAWGSDEVACIWCR